MELHGGVTFADDPLGVALLPVLLHRIRNVTQRLVNLKSLAELDDAAEVLEGRAGEDLARAGEETSEIGWLLAILAGGAGSEVLLARREPTGLATFLELVREGVRSSERDMQPLAEGLRLASTMGWELCWCLGSVLFAAATGRPAGTTLSWRLEPAACDRGRAAWRLVLPDPPSVSAEAGAVARRAVARLEATALAGEVQLECGQQAWIVSFPGSWLHVG